MRASLYAAPDVDAPAFHVAPAEGWVSAETCTAAVKSLCGPYPLLLAGWSAGGW